MTTTKLIFFLAISFSFLTFTASQCTSGQYLDASDSQCYQCDPSCETCSGTASNCLTCSNSNQIASAGVCSFCSSGYVSSHLTNTCGVCYSGGSLCFGPILSSIAKCSGVNYADLSTYTCVSSCPSNTAPISSQSTTFNLCRPLTVTGAFEYYVDPSSTSNFELGTIEHPFKYLISAHIEIFNYVTMPINQVNIYLKSAQNHYVVYSTEPLHILQLFNYNLATYGGASRANLYFDTLKHTTGISATQLTLADSVYSFASRVTLGHMTLAESTSIQVFKFQILRTNSTNIQNINIETLQVWTESLRPLVYTTSNAYGNILIKNCDIMHEGSLLYLTSGRSVQLNNIKLNITNAKSGMAISGPECYSDSPSIQVQDVTIVGYQTKASQSYFDITSASQITFKNLTLNDTKWIAGSSFMSIAPSTSCESVISQQMVNISGLYVQNQLSNNNIQMKIDLSSSLLTMPRVIGIDSIMLNASNIDSNDFLSIKLYNNIANQLVNITNVTTQASTIASKYALISIDSKTNPLNIQQVNATTTKADCLFKIVSTSSATLTAFSTSGYSNIGASNVGMGLVQVVANSGKTLIKDWTITNSSFLTNSLVVINQTNILLISNITVQNVQMNTADMLSILTDTTIGIDTLQLQNISKPSLTDVSIVKISKIQYGIAPYQYLIDQMSYNTSNVTFLSLGSISGTPTNTNQITISNSNFNNNTFLQADSVVKIRDIDTDKLMILVQFNNFTSNYMPQGRLFEIISNLPNVTFFNNTAYNNTGTVMYVQSSSLKSMNTMGVYVNQTIFQENNGNTDALISIFRKANLNIINSTFVQNFGLKKGSTIYAFGDQAKVQVDTSIFNKNYAYIGGCFNLENEASLIVTNSSINNSFAIVGGVAYITNNALIAFISSNITFNSAFQAPIMYLMNSDKSNAIMNCSIQANDQRITPLPRSTQISTLALSQGFLTFKYIQALQLDYYLINYVLIMRIDAAIYQIGSILSLNTSSTIINNQYLIISSSDSSLKIENCIYQNTTDAVMGVTVSNSQATFNNFTIQNVSVGQSDWKSSLIQVVNEGGIDILNSKFLNLRGSLIQGVNAIINIKQGTQIVNVINDNQYLPMIMLEHSYLAIDASNLTLLLSTDQKNLFELYDVRTFMNNSIASKFEKQLFAIAQGSADIRFSNFSHSSETLNRNGTYPSIKAMVFGTSEASILISNCTFTNITTQYSNAAIYAEKSISNRQLLDLKILSTNFTSNTAKQSAGAVGVRNLNATIQNTNFTSNSATLKDAGALHLLCDLQILDKCTFSLTNTTFISNKAGRNGGALFYNQYAPTEVNKIYTCNVAVYGNNTASYGVKLVPTFDPLPRKLDVEEYYYKKDYPSGQVAPPSIVYKIVDNAGVTVASDNSSLATLTTVQVDGNSNASISYETTMQASNGVFNFTNLILSAQPYSKTQLMLNSTAINTALALKIANVNPQTIYLDFNMRPCLIGEVWTQNNTCRKCSNGTYSLVKNSTQCHPCPDGATCLGMNQIVLNSGYWRDNINLDQQIYQCPNSNSCLGGFNSQCAYGYGGFLCQQCLKVNGTFYARSGPFECSPCRDKKWNVLIVFGLVVFFLAFCCYLMKISLLCISGPKTQMVAMRILTHYFHLLYIASAYSLNWNDYIYYMLKFVPYAVRSTEIYLAFECLLKQSQFQESSMFLKLEIILGLPLGYIILAVIVWKLIFCTRRRKGIIKKRLILSVIVFIFVALPAITITTLQIFACKEVIPGMQVLVAESTITCWIGEHDIKSKSIGSLIIILWIFMLPFLTLYYLIKKRHDLETKENLETYGFIYMGLKTQIFFWEMLQHIVKALLIIINVYMHESNLIYKALLGFLVMFIYLELQQTVKPYLEDAHNRLDFRGNLAGFITYFVGLFLVSADVPVKFGYALFALMVIINALFILQFIRHMFQKQLINGKAFCERNCACCNPKTKKSIYEIENSQGGQTSNDTSIYNKESSFNARYGYNNKEVMDQSSAQLLPNGESAMKLGQILAIAKKQKKAEQQKKAYSAQKKEQRGKVVEDLNDEELLAPPQSSKRNLIHNDRSIDSESEEEDQTDHMKIQNDLVQEDSFMNQLKDQSKFIPVAEDGIYQDKKQKKKKRVRNSNNRQLESRDQSQNSNNEAPKLGVKEYISKEEVDGYDAEGDDNRSPINSDQRPQQVQKQFSNLALIEYQKRKEGLESKRDELNVESVRHRD